nr:hypothetical protein CKG001_25030 [Bdellovibrio sp. CKG001]
MIKVFFIFVLFSSLSARAADDLKSFATSLDSTLRHLNAQQSVQCDSSKLTQVQSRTTKLESDNVSVLTEKEAQKLFQELKSNGDIPFEFSIAGCEERAHEMSRLMLLKGITPIKVFASVDENESPRLRRPNPTKTGTTVEWKYHVAPAVLVKKDNKLIPYILDPSLEKSAVPVSAWQASMTQHNPKMKVQLRFTPASQFDERGRLRINFKDDSFNKSIKDTLREYKVRNKSADGEDQYWFELQRNEERMMMFDEGGY